MLMKKTRIDTLMLEKNMVASRSKAAALVMAGQVMVDGQKVEKAGMSFPSNVKIEIIENQRFVSRGGEKLQGALSSFNLDVKGQTCVDVGSSTGGFSDCLLQNGAEKIYCIDVGKGILHWKLRSNRRIVVMEETNARNVASLPEPIDLVVCDASFISLKTLLPVFEKWLNPTSNIITLVKPQFEAGRVDVARGKGVVRDIEIHKRVLEEVTAFAIALGFSIKGLVKSTLYGPKGNTEFLMWLDKSGETADVAEMITQALLLPELDIPTL